MTMRGLSRTAVGIVAVLVATSMVATSLAAGLGAGQATTSDHVQLGQDGPTLEVTVDQSSFGVNGSGNATITVAFGDTQVASDVPVASTGDGTYQYRVNLANKQSIAGMDLSSVNVTVTPKGGNASRIPDNDLRYVRLADSRASFDGNELVLPVAQSVGVPDGATVQLSGSAGETSGALTATMRANDPALVVQRTAPFPSLAFASRNLTVESSGNLVFDGGTYDVWTAAGNPSASVDGGTVEVTHPLLFEGQEYTLTVTTPTEDGEAVTTRTTTAGDGSVTLEAAGAVTAESTIDVQHGDINLGTADVPADPAPKATLSDDGRNVTDLSRFDGTGTTAVTVLSGESGDELRELRNVSYRDGKVLFGDAGYELATNASYLLVFEPASGDAFTATLDEGDASPAVNAIGGGGDGGGGSPFDLGTIFGLPGIVVLGGGVVGVVLFVGAISRIGGGSSRSQSGHEMMDVTVRVADGMTNELVDQSSRIQFVPTNDPSLRPVTRTVTGKNQVEIPSGVWEVSFESDTVSESDLVSSGDSRAELNVPPRTEQITVTAAGSGTRISDATVELTYPNDGSSDERWTDADGNVSFKIPYTVDDRECELRVDHDRYESTTRNGLTGTVRLQPETGSARIEAHLDGEPVPGVDVVVEPDDEYTRQVADSAVETADDSGTVTLDSLPVGEYVAHLDFEDSTTVETSPVTLDVTADGRVTETINGEFSFRLDEDQRARIDDLHRDISDLTPSNRDGAIPYYYGSVLSAVLSTVDEFPDAGVVFVRNGVDPDDVTEATIQAVDQAVGYTQTAMTEKQNVDLFSACRGLREARVKWDGDVSVPDLVSFVGDEKANHRREMIDRLESVKELLDQKQDTVSTVTPARDQYEQVREHATGQRDRSPVEQRAQFFVGLQLLDAVESMFDEPELVDRLEETVF
jgi:hypothetical protein